MGLMLDSSIVIAAERSGEVPSQLFARIASAIGEQQLVISSVALT